MSDGLRTLRDGDVHVWFTQPKHVPHDSLDAYVRLMTQSERERGERYHFEKDRMLHAIARALVRTTLSQYADVPPDAWRFEAGKHGRPSISAPSADLAFNLTHTAGFVACAVSREPEVGVDVEQVSPDRATAKLSQRVFSKREYSEFDRLPESEKPGRFFDLWTLKESYIKARGLGLAIPLRAFGFHLMDDAAPSIEIADELDDDAATWSFRHWSPTPEHRLAVALRRRRGAPLRVTSYETVPLAPDAAAGERQSHR